MMRMGILSLERCIVFTRRLHLDYVIAGARQSLLREFRGCVERDGSYVNYRHLGTLVDVMTFRVSLCT